jgi:cyclopropane fatty-acyl-phospholipid synthase-like methyltransferase
MFADLQHSIAQTLETEEQLLPLIPELLADLSELGASTDHVVAALKDFGLQPGSRAIDLGCGKGAVAVAIAERLGLAVDAVDGLPAFVDASRKLAEKHGVAAKCCFRCADLRDYFGETGDYDAVLLLSVGPVAGDHQLTIEALRGLTRPGGLIVIDDGFLAPGVDRRGRYPAYPGHDEMLKRLTAFGDGLLRETIFDADATRAVNMANTALIRQRAAGLKQQHPELAEAIDAYVARQEVESERLGHDLIGAMWVLERAP